MDLKFEIVCVKGVVIFFSEISQKERLPFCLGLLGKPLLSSPSFAHLQKNWSISASANILVRKFTPVAGLPVGNGGRT